MGVAWSSISIDSNLVVASLGDAGLVAVGDLIATNAKQRPDRQRLLPGYSGGTWCGSQGHHGGGLVQDSPKPWSASSGGSRPDCDNSIINMLAGCMGRASVCCMPCACCLVTLVGHGLGPGVIMRMGWFNTA
jgi:hypothetical protein